MIRKHLMEVSVGFSLLAALNGCSKVDLLNSRGGIAAGSSEEASLRPAAASARKSDIPILPAPQMSDNEGQVSKFIRYQYAPGEITTACQAVRDRTSARLLDVAQVPAAERTLQNTILAFESALADFWDDIGPLTFMGYVSTDEALRDEGSACEAEAGKYVVDIYTREDVFAALSAVQDQAANLPQQKRLLAETLKSFKANGLGLPAPELEVVRKLKSELAQSEAEFSANYNGDASFITATAADLEGLSAAFVATLQKNAEGLYILTTKSTHYTQVMQNAKLSETRRRMLLAYQNRAADKNVALLEGAILKRNEIARAMGFATWADYRTNGRMAGDEATVRAFLADLRAKLAPRKDADLAKLLAFKKELDPSATKLDVWDINYLSYQLKKRDFTLDDDVIREYFPANKVVEAMFEVYSKLLSVKLQEVTEGPGADTWAPGVKLYAIRDSRTEALIGYFYADLNPRAGKYNHAAAFSLILGRRADNGGYSLPISAMVANFNPPVGDKPSLLNHDEVETLFHEFGHIIHQTITRAPYASLAGTSVAQDFVEAPSQMLENWVWNSEVLGKISGHYQTGAPLPAELLQKMLAAKDFNQGYLYSRQIFLASVDLAYHTSSGPVDTTAVHDQIYREVIGVEPQAGGHFQASFGHLMGGYDAGYYGYLWSEVYALDMFTRFQADGLLNPTTGMQYRNYILEQGNLHDAIDLLRAFLGREPSNEAFLKNLGIGKAN